MNSFFKNLIGLTIISYSLTGMVQAKETVAVLSDNLRPVATNYIIYSETSNLIAQDVANRINTHGKINALPVCNTINNAQKQAISKEVIQFSKEFQYTYNLNYDILRKISDKLGANYILLISSGIDIETDFLKETLWNKIPLAGENSVKPGYKVCTQISLIDPKKELILFTKNYDKCISSKDFDLVMPTFSPSSIQLDKFQDYSEYIAKMATPIIENTIVPDLVPVVKRTFSVKLKYKVEQITEDLSDTPNKNTVVQAPESSGLQIKPNPDLKQQNGIRENL